MTPDRWMNRGSRYGRSLSFTSLAAALLGILTGGCGQPGWEEADAEQEPRSTADVLRDGFSRRASDTNGLDSNTMAPYGMATNGMATNGMATNGMATNGLRLGGLSVTAMKADAFITWFNQDTALANMVMHYVVACGVSDGSLRAWRNPTTGVRYVWNGVFGLTPGWASGQPASVQEQELITACLAAHTNKYGLEVLISVQGRDALGTPIPVGPQELTRFAQREGCFFGNIFNDEGAYAGSDGQLSSASSSVRACGLVAPGAGDTCSPIHHVGSCADICTLDLSGNSYVSCSYNGKSYPAITTRIQLADINVCGDGVCQISESCGTGLTPNSCMDCGPCP